MSLDVYLEGIEPAERGSGIFVREDGAMREISREEWERRYPGREPVVADVTPDYGYHGNITHNLGEMAAAVGLYEPLWRPDEIGIARAADLVEPLTAGLLRLCLEADACRAHNPPNGWGTYEGFVRFVAGYLDACRRFPAATVRVWR